MKNGLVKEPDKQEFYARIHGESQRMISLVEDIIRLSHLDEGAQDMQRERVDLFELAKETAKQLLPEAETAKITLEVSGEPTEINGIPQLLSSIIYNLIDNAIKYNHEGGRVAVSVKNADNKAILAVEDTGIGIPKEHRERIFERFYRVDKSRSKALGGTGLGLSIVKHAAMIHGARIEVESEVGKGTRVEVDFTKE